MYMYNNTYPQSTAHVFVKYIGTSPGGTSVSLMPTSSSAVVDMVSSTFTVMQPGPPAGIQLTLRNQMSLESCQSFTARLVDSNGRPTLNTGSAITLNFASSSATATFTYASGTSCGTTNGSPSLTIGNGSSSAVNFVGYSPLDLGPQSILIAQTAGTPLVVNPQMINVAPAVANHLLVLVQGEVKSGGAAAGIQAYFEQNASMSFDVYALTPSNAIDTSFSGPLDLFTTGGTYATLFQSPSFVNGHASINIQNNASAGMIQAQVSSNALPNPSAVSNFYVVNPNPAGSRRFRLLSRNSSWAQGRCEQLLVSLNHAAVSSVSGSVAASAPFNAVISSTGVNAASFYNASDCSGTTTGNLNFAPGERAKLIGVIASGSNTSVMVSGGGYNNASWSSSVNPPSAAGPPTNLMSLFYYDSNSPFHMFAGTCSPIALGLSEANGSAIAISPIRINVTSPIMDYYSDPSCTTPISYATIPAGHSAVLYYGRATVMGTDPGAFTSGPIRNDAGLTGEAHTLVVH